MLQIRNVTWCYKYIFSSYNTDNVRLRQHSQLIARNWYFWSILLWLDIISICVSNWKYSLFSLKIKSIQKLLFYYVLILHKILSVSEKSDIIKVWYTNSTKYGNQKCNFYYGIMYDVWTSTFCQGRLSIWLTCCFITSDLLFYMSINTTSDLL
jgi:hypothetical protein